MTKIVLGHDMSECVSPTAAMRVAETARHLLSADIMEMYSPERVTKMCKKFGLQAGCSLDLTNGFNFDLAADRSKAWQILERDRHCWS